MTGAGIPGFDPAAAFSSAARQFLGLLQSLGAGGQAGAPTAAFAGAGGGASTPGLAGAQLWNPVAMTAALAGQFEHWLRTAQLTGSWLGSDATAAAGGAAAASAWLRGLIPAAEAPGFTQWQRQAQELWELLQRIAALQAQLSPYWSEIAAEAARRFTAQPGAPLRQPTSLQEALQTYERWVESAEGAYAAIVHRADFCHLQAQLINASAALLAWQRRHAQALQQAFALPARDEPTAPQEQAQGRRAAAGRPRRAAGNRGRRKPVARNVTAPRKNANSRNNASAVKTSREGKARRPAGARRRRRH